MSATGRTECRRERDSYQTPSDLCHEIILALQDYGYLDGCRTILEPSAGDGNFVRAIIRHFGLHPHIAVNDIYISDYATELAEMTGIPVTQHDFLNFPNDARFDLIIGNPPYRNAEAHVRKGISLLAKGGTLAFLLRMGFLASKRRVPFWEDHPADHIFALAERPSYTDGGTDATDYGVFVWTNGPKRKTTTIEVLSWK
jgi:hypothetical protein